MTFLSSFSFLFDGGGQARSLLDKIVLGSNPATTFGIKAPKIKSATWRRSYKLLININIKQSDWLMVKRGNFGPTRMLKI